MAKAILLLVVARMLTHDYLVVLSVAANRRSGFFMPARFAIASRKSHLRRNEDRYFWSTRRNFCSLELLLRSYIM